MECEAHSKRTERPSVWGLTTMFFGNACYPEGVFNAQNSTIVSLNNILVGLNSSQVRLTITDLTVVSSE